MRKTIDEKAPLGLDFEWPEKLYWIALTKRNSVFNEPKQWMAVSETPLLAWFLGMLPMFQFMCDAMGGKEFSGTIDEACAVARTMGLPEVRLIGPEGDPDDMFTIYRKYL